MSVRLQQRNQGHHVDDIVVQTEGANRLDRLFLQVKRGVAFAESDSEFCAAIGQCWREAQRSTFDGVRDIVAIAMDAGSNTQKIQRHFQELLTWAREHSATDTFRKQVQQFADKKKFLATVRTAIGKATGKRPSVANTHTFLKRLRIIPFDFEQLTSKDHEHALERIRGLLRTREDGHALLLWGWLKERAAQMAKAGGDATLFTLKDQLPDAIELELPEDAEHNLNAIDLQIRVHGEARLRREVDSGKYLPGLFAESPAPKDHARAFADPLWGLTYVSSRLNQQRFEELDRHLSVVGLKPFGALGPTPSIQPSTLADVPKAGERMSRHFKTITDRLEPMAKEYAKSLEGSVPRPKAYVFKESRFLIGMASYWAKDWVDEFEPWLDSVRQSIVCLTAPAGQGKSNFVCDLIHRSLAPRGVPYLHFTGRDFRSWHNGPLESFILADVLGQEAINHSERYWKSLKQISGRAGKPLVLILDGLNEHNRIDELGIALEQMLGRLLQKPWVRVVLTCRSEYFERRFGNLKKGAIARKTVFLREPIKELTYTQSERMVWGYFEEYGLDVHAIGGRVFGDLRRDPLLLRTFCEAYGNRPPTIKVILPVMQHLYKDRLYKQFFERRLDQGRQHSVTLANSTASSRARSAIRAMIGWMIKHKEYGHVPLGDIPVEHHEAIELLLDQELILRRDLASSPLASNAEVLAFTFDEMRDYLLAEYIGWTWQQDQSQVKQIVTDLGDPSFTIAEGVSRFLWMIARRDRVESLRVEIENAPWFGNVFLDCVFDLHDDDVDDADLESIRREFAVSNERASMILRGLLWRHSRTRYPRLNLSIIFSVINELDDKMYRSLFLAAFRAGDYHRFDGPQAVPIDKLVAQTRAWLDGRTCLDLATDDNLLMLMAYLLPVRGESSWTPTRTLLFELREKCPDAVFAVLAKLLEHPPETIANEVWNLVGDIVRPESKIPPSLLSLANAPFTTPDRLGTRAEEVRVQRARALLRLSEKGKVKLSKERAEEVGRIAAEEVTAWMKFI